mmetsp:Transcript_29668/g.62927  ORF Transcript_29668/g.62927 Transcript_29668/m.62927 type:complete len:353 (-) Transcript_29668:1883-2941(-)
MAEEWRRLSRSRASLSKLAEFVEKSQKPAEDFTVKTFESADKNTIGYRTIGPEDGLPVLCLHGLSLHGGMWSDVAVFLARLGYRVIAMDFYGRGNSPWPGKHEKILDCSCCSDAVYCSDNLLVQQAVELLTYLGIAQVELLIGHSMGGGTAIALAARHPQLVKRVFVTAPVGLPIQAGKSFVLPRELRWLLWIRTFYIGRKSSYRYWILRGNSAGIAMGQADDFVDKEKHKIKAAEQVQFAADNLGNDADGFVVAWLSTLRNFPLGYGAPSGDLLSDYETLGANKSMPITLVWGEEDVTCPIKGEGEKIVRNKIPHAKLLVMPKAGHAVIYEEAQVVVDEITAILQQSTTVS